MDNVVLKSDNTTPIASIETMMASIETILRPVKDTHSIKEVVITVFLGNSIDLDEFARIQLPDVFANSNRVEEIRSFNISPNGDGVDAENPELLKPERIGVRLAAEEEGKVIRLLQGINESDRTFISYHNLNYKRWEQFFHEYLEYITVVTNYLKDVNVQAFSLHYIDEFEWLNDGKIEPRVIFNEMSKYLPEEFFNVISSSFQLITEKLFEDNTCYDRIEINTDNSNKTITISHNLVRVLSNQTQLMKLIKSDEFERILRWAHNQNKLFLKEVLHKEVIQLVNLT